MKVKLKESVQRGSVPEAWYSWYRCDDGHDGTGFPGGIEVELSIDNPGYATTTCHVCVPALNKALGNERVRLRGSSSSDPFGLSGDPWERVEITDEKLVESVAALLADRGPVTHYWDEGGEVLALGPDRKHLTRLLGIPVKRPEWAREFARILDRASFTGWLAEGGRLSPLGAARLAVVGGLQGGGGVVLAAARLKAPGDSAPSGVSGAHAETELLKSMLSRTLVFRDSPPLLGLVLREISDAPLLALHPAKGDRLDAVCSLGAGRWARVQVESLDGRTAPLAVSLASGSLDDAESPLVIRADGGDLRLWMGLGCAPALEGVLPPGPRRRLAASRAAVPIDDDDGDDEDGNPNWPSTTGNPSGGGRGNNPPGR